MTNNPPTDRERALEWLTAVMWQLKQGPHDLDVLGAIEATIFAALQNKPAAGDVEAIKEEAIEVFHNHYDGGSVDKSIEAVIDRLIENRRLK